MKKLVTLLLALSLVFTMAFSASAAVGQGTNSQTITINLNSVGGDGTAAETVYYVDVAWANTTLTFTADNGEAMVEWDPNNHVYKVIEGVSATGTWSASPSVTMGNHTNADVDLAFAGSAGNGVTLTPSRTAATLARADQGDYLNDPSKFATVTVTFDPRSEEQHV